MGRLGVNVIKEGYRYNDVLFLSLDYEANAVCKLEGNFPVFVPLALKDEIGDIVIEKLYKNYAFGRLIRISKKSPFRVEAKCEHFEECGGCNLMNLDYEAQLAYKKELTMDTLKRVGGIICQVNDTLTTNKIYNYRNKIEMPFGFRNKEVIAGFYKKKTHELVNQNSCQIAPIEADEITSFLKSFFTFNKIPIYDEKRNTGSIKHIITRTTKLNETMIIIVSNTPSFPSMNNLVNELIERFPNTKSIVLNYNPGKTSLVMGKNNEVIYGNDYILEEILGVKLKISASSFSQVNTDAAELLYKKAIEYADLSGSEEVIDAYCGVGSISLCLAKKAKYVYGIEIVESAIKNAEENKRINGITNVEFILGACEEKISFLAQSKNIDVIVFDPPRKGCDRKFIDTVINMKIKRIVYISCNIRTLARDLSILKQDGYEIIKATPVDLFPNTSNIENICLLSLK